MVAPSPAPSVPELLAQAEEAAGETLEVAPAAAASARPMEAHVDDMLKRISDRVSAASQSQFKPLGRSSEAKGPGAEKDGADQRSPAPRGFC